MRKRKTFLPKGKLIYIILCVIILWGTSFPQICYAGLADGNAFEGTVWEMVMETPRANESGGVAQALCTTEDYIITLENFSDFTADPDIVSAYYKNDTDADGNPVEQYSLAKQVQSTNYEHANGMAYNPNTGEILVAGYTSSEDENIGCLFIMDANTLEYKDKVQISGDFNILGVDYMPNTDQYVIQTDASGGYSFKILSADYQVAEDLGKYEGTSKGSNFQDLCVDGDFIINFPLTYGMGIGDFINVYSISQRTLLACNQLNFNFESNVIVDEPESICQTAPGEFMALVNVDLEGGARVMRVYKTTVPYLFSVAASAENATISEGSDTVLRGSDFTLNYAPAKGQQLTSLLVNGEKVDLKKNPSSYLIQNIQSNYTVSLTSEKIVVKDKKAADSKSISPTKKLVIGFLCLALIGGAWYMRLLYVRRMRALKRRRARRRIQRQKNDNASR